MRISGQAIQSAVSAEIQQLPRAGVARTGPFLSFGARKSIYTFVDTQAPSFSEILRPEMINFGRRDCLDGVVAASMRFRDEVRGRGGRDLKRSRMLQFPMLPMNQSLCFSVWSLGARACRRERGFSRARFRDTTKVACSAAPFTSAPVG